MDTTLKTFLKNLERVRQIRSLRIKRATAKQNLTENGAENCPILVKKTSFQGTSLSILLLMTLLGMGIMTMRNW